MEPPDSSQAVDHGDSTCCAIGTNSNNLSRRKVNAEGIFLNKRGGAYLFTQPTSRGQSRVFKSPFEIDSD